MIKISQSYFHSTVLTAKLSLVLISPMRFLLSSVAFISLLVQATLDLNAMAESNQESRQSYEHVKNNRQLPKILVSLNLDLPVHSFSSDKAPTLTVTITSLHEKPITIYGDELRPNLMITYGAFKLIDLSTGDVVHHSRRRYCKIPPPTKVEVPLQEELLHTLMPNIPLSLSAPFGLDRKPLAGSDVDRKDPRASIGAVGVDGLYPGHRYQLLAAEQPGINWNSIHWWEYGTKVEVLNSPSGKPDGREARYGHGPHPAIVIDPKSVSPIEFECID